MNSILRPTEAVIHLRSLKKNFDWLRGLTSSHFFCPMVKANAYGFGMVETAPHLVRWGAKYLGVATIEEGIALRSVIPSDTQILCFTPFDRSGLQAILEYQLTPVIMSKHELQLVAELGHPVGVHIKFDTNMHRLGLSIDELPKLDSWIKSHPQVQVLGVCSHLACAELMGAGEVDVDEQFRQFERIKSFLKDRNVGALHFYNSAALIAQAQLGDSMYPNSYGARVGISLYGAVSDFKLPQVTNWGRQHIELAMSLYSQVVLTREVKKGEFISYGASWRADRDSLIGVLPIGYADGLRRGLSNRLNVLVNEEHLCPLVGTICMDYCFVDLTQCKGLIPARPKVLFFGGQGIKKLSIESLALPLSTIPYEIMTGLSDRVHRVYEG